jgi:dynactin complex subunit
MKMRETGVRLKRFYVAETARRAGDLETMIREFEMMTTDLDRQILAEEDRTGIRDKLHFAYSTLAKSVIQRRDNIATSIEDLRARLEIARREHDEALEELRRLEANEPREERSSHRHKGSERNIASA